MAGTVGNRHTVQSKFKEFWMAKTRRVILTIFGVRKESSSSNLNIVVKEVLSKVGIDSSAQIFSWLKKIYRRSGTHIRVTKSTSFNGEDLALARYLPEVNGKYLDIGSGDPVQGSNTYLFYKRGWSGITIDPLTRATRKHKRKRKRDQQIIACVSDLSFKNAEVLFYEYDADDFSTTSEQRFLELQAQGVTPKVIRKVKAIFLKELELKTNPLEAFLLDIDIEGDEFSVLNTLDWVNFLPRVIAVEEWKSPIYVITKVRTLLESKGYLLEARASVTSIYVHSAYLNTL